MSTCKECYHYKACIKSAEEAGCICDDITASESCDFFLERARVYIVPHKVGDPIWTREPFADGEMRQGYIEAVTFGGIEEGIWSYWATFAGLSVSYEFITDDIGKTVFLTREEAEAAISANKEA